MLLSKMGQGFSEKLCQKFSRCAQEISLFLKPISFYPDMLITLEGIMPTLTWQSNGDHKNISPPNPLRENF